MSRERQAGRSPSRSRRGPKVRTADCRKCLFLKSLQDAGVPASTVLALCERMWLNHARRGQILYTEGNGATHLYAIRKGRVKLVKSDSHGRERVTGLLGPGDLFGFEALFEQAYSSGAEAIAGCELCLASADQLHDLMAEVPRVATDLAKYLHFQLSRARDRQVAVTATGASAKVAAYLLQSVDGDGADGLTLKDLGGMLGLAPETICRVMADLRTRGIVEPLPSGVRIRDVDALRLISGL